jgi:hypothetical protein
MKHSSNAGLGSNPAASLSSKLRKSYEASLELSASAKSELSPLSVVDCTTSTSLGGLNLGNEKGYLSKVNVSGSRRYLALQSHPLLIPLLISTRTNAAFHGIQLISSGSSGGSIFI